MSLYFKVERDEDGYRFYLGVNLDSSSILLIFHSNGWSTRLESDFYLEIDETTLMEGHLFFLVIILLWGTTLLDFFPLSPIHF